MTYELRYHPLVVREDIPKLGVVMKDRIRSAMERKVTTQPDLFGIPLRRSLQGHRKLRVGDVRIVFRIQGSQVFILAILRSQVYQRVEKRI